MESNIDSLIRESEDIIDTINNIEIENKARERYREELNQKLERLREDTQINANDFKVASDAIKILKTISDKSIKDSYEFIAYTVNQVLVRVFGDDRRIKLHEYIHAGQFPQLEIELYTENGVMRSLKMDSGHGLMQVVSIMCILSLIVITNSRRLLVIDEVISGLDERTREIISDIMWNFTKIGFQFITNEHGFIPKGAKVYVIDKENGTGYVKETYIEQYGNYLGTQRYAEEQQEELV